MIRYSLIALTLALLTWPPVSRAQITAEELRTMLRRDAGFSDDELEQLKAGSIVVKTLPSKDKNEVSVCGVVRVQTTGELSMSRFAASMAQTNNESILARGKFSMPPSIDDLRALRLGKADIDDLKKCKVGDCKLNLSAAMIDKIQNGVDWTAADAAATAPAQVFQQILLEYAADYVQRGSDALIQYDNRQNAVRLDEENRILLEKALFIGDIAPEFVKYLRDVPRAQLASVERSLDWSTVTFGLDPIIAITDTARYAPGGGNAPQYLIATRQVYASRYSDASLALSMLITASAAGEDETYVIFSNRSRSGSLRGLFGGVKRSLAGGEAVSRIKTILELARDRLETTPSTSIRTEQPMPLTTLDVVREQINMDRVLILVCVVAAFVIILLVYGRKRI